MEIKITIKKYLGDPVDRDGKIIVINEIHVDSYEETLPTDGVEDLGRLKRDFIDRTARSVARFNVEQENLARADRSRPKKRIYKLIISNIT